MKRGILIGIPVVLVTLIAVLLIAPGFIDWSQYKTQIQQQIKTATGYDAEFGGGLSIALLPSPRAIISDVKVAASQGSASDYLIKLGRLEAHLALAPLLSGKVEVSSIKLVEPSIALQVFENGKGNWMTPQLEKMMSAGGQAGSAAPQVSLKNVSIEKGAFTYQAHGAAPVEINGINVTAEAKTLRGPFSAQGSFALSGHSVDMKATTGALDASQSLAVNAAGKIKPMNLAFEYAGVVSTAAPLQMQGETNLVIDSIEDLIGKNHKSFTGRIVAKGLMTASQDQVEFKNASFELGPNNLTGDLAAKLAPLKITGDLKASETVNLDNFIAKGGKNGGDLLPATITLPVPFDASVKISAPGIIWNGGRFKDADLEILKSGKKFAAGFSSSGIPGNGSLNAQGAVIYAAKSVSKDKSEIYSDPNLVIEIKGKTANIAQTMKALTGAEYPALAAWKSGAIDASAEVKPNLLKLKDTSVTLGDDRFSVAGSYATGAGRPKMTVDISAEKMDFDAIQKKLGGAEPQPESGGLEEKLKALSLPFDLDFDVGAQSARLQGKDIKGLRAQGSLTEKSLKLENLSAQDYAGAAVALSGSVADLKKLAGIDLRFQAQAPDAKNLAAALGMDASGFPQATRAASLDAAAQGDLSRVAVRANIKALNGTLIASGDVDDPLGKMALGGLEIQANHPNLAQAIQAFSPGSPRYVSMEKPLEFYAKVNRSGNIYALDDMKANIAGSPVIGSVSVDVSAAKPAVKGDLVFDRLAIQSEGAAQGGSRWSGETINTVWMNAYEADISVKANQILYQNWDLREPTLELALHGGRMEVSRMDAALFGGQMNVKSSLQAAAGGKGISALNADAAFSGVSMEPLMRALLSTDLINGRGAVNMNLSLAGAGNSMRSIVASLQGKGDLNGKEITLSGFDQLSSLLKLDAITFERLEGAYTISQGVVSLREIVLDGPQAALISSGSLNLPAWTLRTTHDLTLKDQTDLGAIPFGFTGSISRPVLSVEQILKGVINRAVEKQIGNFLQDALGGDKKRENSAAPPAGSAPVEQGVPAPAAGDEDLGGAPLPAQDFSPPPPKSDEDVAKEAIEGVLKGLLGQ